MWDPVATKAFAEAEATAARLVLLRVGMLRVDTWPAVIGRRYYRRPITAVTGLLLFGGRSSQYETRGRQYHSGVASTRVDSLVLVSMCRHYSLRSTCQHESARDERSQYQEAQQSVRHSKRPFRTTFRKLIMSVTAKQLVICVHDTCTDTPYVHRTVAYE